MTPNIVFLLCSRPATVNWSPSGPVVRSASRLCLAIPAVEADDRAMQLVLAGYSVEMLEQANYETISL